MMVKQTGYVQKPLLFDPSLLVHLHTQKSLTDTASSLEQSYHVSCCLVCRAMHVLVIFLKSFWMLANLFKTDSKSDISASNCT